LVIRSRPRRVVPEEAFDLGGSDVKRLQRFIAAATIAGAVVVVPATTALASGNPSGTGQPSQECEDVRPGHAAAAPGSAFNPDGNAGTHYAGEQPQNSTNPHSVSQYDVACFHQPSNP
jgi:hypothetical protein